MKSQAQKAAEFEALHKAPGCFVIPNPWDPGSARILAGLGFRALTTTSAGYARSIGFPDYNAGRENVMAHIRAIAPAIDIPLAADLEDGFGSKPEDCAETIRQGAASGLVGGSIEDFTGDRGDPIHPIEKAAERVRAAAEAAKKLPFKFMLCARAAQGDADGRTGGRARRQAHLDWRHDARRGDERDDRRGEGDGIDRHVGVHEVDAARGRNRCATDEGRSGLGNDPISIGDSA